MKLRSAARVVAAAAACAAAGAQSGAFVSRGLVLDLRAIDYAEEWPGPGWDNRASGGPFSSASSADFVPAESHGAPPPALVQGGGGRPAAWGLAIDGAPLVASNAPALVSGSPLGFGGVFGTSDWTAEAWYWSDGTVDRSGVLPLVHWGSGAGLLAVNASDFAAAGAPPPAAGQWHHLALACSGFGVDAALPIAPIPDVHSTVGRGRLRLYLDGVVVSERTVGSSVVRPTGAGGLVAIGGYLGSSGAVAIPANGLLLGQVRLHDGLLSNEEVAHNYAIDAGAYRGPLAGSVPWSAAAASSQPGLAAGCPARWRGPTHELRAVSMQLADAWATSNAFFRHACFNVFVTQGFSLLSSPSGDATQLLRVAFDGSPAGVSLQSGNNPGLFLSIHTVGTPDLTYSRPLTAIGLLNGAVRSRFSWELLANGSSVILTSRAQGFEGWFAARISSAGLTSTRACSNGDRDNLRLFHPGSSVPPARFMLREGLMSLPAMSSTVTSSRSDLVVLESLQSRGWAVATCGAHDLLVSGHLSSQTPRRRCSWCQHWRAPRAARATPRSHCVLVLRVT